MVKRRIQVLETGVQTFRQRFPGKGRTFDDGVPDVSLWRCNLTGLSQRHNLYFVAYRSALHVYIPEFPSQAINEPVLIVPSKPSASDLEGTISDRDPHAINNVVVSLLGKEEVIATVRDDGDVEVVLVRHIVRAIRDRSNPGNSIGKVADEIRPVFQGNVGVSAWGLAIHARARIIAVSSNDHKVTIFKLALLERLDSSAHEEENERNTEVIVKVVNGDANIPHVAFCNTGDDHEARWLLTTDITGICRTIDLHRFEPVHEFRFGEPYPFTNQRKHDLINSGWTIAFLDRRSFLAEPSLHDALGLQDTQSLPEPKYSAKVWDASETVKNVENVSDCFVFHKRTDDKLRSRGSSSTARRQQDRARTATETRRQPLRQRGEMDDGAMEEQTVHAEEEVDEYEDEEREDDAEDMSVDEFPEEEVGSITSADHIDTVEQLEEMGGAGNGAHIFKNAPRFNKSRALCDNLPCPIFHTSVNNIYILQATTGSTTDPPFQPPFVGVAHPLRQSLQYNYRMLNMFERLNMTAHIPTLGVVVVASQKGRAVVLALTRLSRTAEYPPGMEQSARQTNYAMRIDAILPFASQERLNQRPFAPIHGIAVSPIQGTERLPEHKRRWRLMIMYQDHSVFSYEIVRERYSGVDVRNLVV